MDTIYSATIQERGVLGFNYQFVIRDEDLTAAATTETIELIGDIAAGDISLNWLTRIDTNFDGGATTDLTIDVGYDLAAGTDDPDAFINAQIIHEDATEVVYNLNSGAVGDYVFLEAADIDALFTATGANVSVLDAGQISVFGQIVRVSELPVTQAT
jgi:hypothetical protein